MACSRVVVVLVPGGGVGGDVVAHVGEFGVGADDVVVEGAVPEAGAERREVVVMDAVDVVVGGHGFEPLDDA